MFLDKGRKMLDYNFLLWKFDTTKLDHRALARLDGATTTAEPKIEEDPAFANDKGKCTIF